MAEPVFIGGELLPLIRTAFAHCAGSEEKSHTCPECGGDCWRVGLQDLVYTFEVCLCPGVHFPHLYEQLWHRSCLVRREKA